MNDPRQLPLEPTEHINPATQVDRMPGTDAVCLCPGHDKYTDNTPCLWPFCGWKDHTARDRNNEQEDVP